MNTPFTIILLDKGVNICNIYIYNICNICNICNMCYIIIYTIFLYQVPAFTSVFYKVEISAYEKYHSTGWYINNLSFSIFHVA